MSLEENGVNQELQTVVAVVCFGTALSVLGSALGPVIMGALMDAGLQVSSVLYIFAAYVLVGSVLLRIGVNRRG